VRARLLRSICAHSAVDCCWLEFALLHVLCASALPGAQQDVAQLRPSRFGLSQLQSVMATYVMSRRRYPAVDARVRAYLFTWREGRTTLEDEFIPVRAQQLELPPIETLLVVPTVLEHTIDERSPLHGLGYDDLVARGAEILVSFEGTSDFGDSFAVRRSYLASEILWGRHFAPIVAAAAPGRLRHTADLSRFHEVVRHADVLRDATPAEACARVLGGAGALAPRALPFPALGDNTLVVSSVCATYEQDGAVFLLFRVGDTRPGNMLEAHVRGYLLEWHPQPTAKDTEGHSDVAGGGVGVHSNTAARLRRHSTPYTMSVRCSYASHRQTCALVGSWCLQVLLLAAPAIAVC
jgi:Inward rectifier potassium channel C-terminal domain